MIAEQRVGEVTVDTEGRQRDIQTRGRVLRFLFSLPLRSPVTRPDGLPSLVVPSHSLGAVSHGNRRARARASLGVLAHHPVVSSLHLLLAVVRVQQQPRSHGNICTRPLGWRLVFLSSGGIVTKPDATWESVSQSAQPVRPLT